MWSVTGIQLSSTTINVWSRCGLHSLLFSHRATTHAALRPHFPSLFALLIKLRRCAGRHRTSCKNPSNKKLTQMMKNVMMKTCAAFLRGAARRCAAFSQGAAPFRKAPGEDFERDAEIGAADDGVDQDLNGATTVRLRWQQINKSCEPWLKPANLDSSNAAPRFGASRIGA